MFKVKTKICQNCKIEFTIELEDFEFYKKIGVPEPTFCPECRNQRRLTFRSGRILYKRKVEKNDKEVFSCISPNSPFKVYDSKYWWSDKMDGMKYGQDYDFSKPFFEQLKELMYRVGVPHSAVLNVINSPYSNNAVDIKDCYLTFNAGMSENCVYGIDIQDCKDCFDTLKINTCELSYELFDCNNCYQVFFSSECYDCQEIYFSKNLVNCQKCFGCTNLKHKKYHIFNKQYNKKEYEEKIKEFNLGSYINIKSFKKEIDQEHLKHPVKYMHGRKNVDVVGDHLDNCKNVKNSFFNRDLEDCSYCQLILFFPSKDCYDIAVAGGELCYEIEESGGYKTNFCWYNMPKSLKNHDAGLYEMEYVIGGVNSHHLFGCVGLKNKSYCIFNKQYSKEEYEELIPKIKEHMNEMPYTDKKGNVYKYGEFFPSELSPYGYNETVANEYFPLSEEQAKKNGFNWYNKLKTEYKPTIKTSDLPDNIKDIDESMLKEIIECENKDCTGTKVFRLISNELEFYKKQNIPIPRLCPDCRHQQRIKQRNPMKLWERQCMKEGCNTKFQTTYSPNRKEIVYCEKCYQKEVE